MGNDVSKPLESMTAEEVSACVRGLGTNFSTYADAIIENHVSGDILVSLDRSQIEESLDDLEVNSRLHQHVLTKKLKALQAGRNAERQGDGIVNSLADPKFDKEKNEEEGANENLAVQTSSSMLNNSSLFRMKEEGQKKEEKGTTKSQAVPKSCLILNERNLSRMKKDDDSSKRPKPKKELHFLDSHDLSIIKEMGKESEEAASESGSVMADAGNNDDDDNDEQSTNSNNPAIDDYGTKSRINDLEGSMQHIDGEISMQHWVPLLDDRVKKSLNFLIREQIRAEETTRIAEQIVSEKHVGANIAEMKLQDDFFLTSEQNLERKLLSQRQEVEANELVEKYSVEHRRAEEEAKVEAKELRLHQLQHVYNLTMSFRRQIQHKRDSFDENVRVHIERENEERTQVRLQQQRERENALAVQELMAANLKSDRKRRTFLKECKLTMQQLSELQRREAEQFREMQSTKSRMVGEAFDQEIRGLESRHMISIESRLEIERMQASHLEEIKNERARSLQRKQEMEASHLKETQQLKARQLNAHQIAKKRSLRAKQFLEADQKRTRLANKVKEQLSELNDHLQNYEATSASSSWKTPSSRTPTSCAAESQVAEENLSPEELDALKQLKNEDVEKENAVLKLHEAEEAAKMKTQSKLSEQLLLESEQRLNALRKQHDTVEAQLIKQQEKKLEAHDFSVAEQVRGKSDEDERVMFKLRTDHAKERQEMRIAHERELGAFRKTETLSALSTQNAVIEASSKSKTDFLAFVCHELRNPLHAMVAVVELIMGDKNIAMQEVKDHLAQLHQQTDLMSAIVNDVLDLSKIESGKLDLNFTPFNAKEMVESIVHDQALVVKKMDKDVKVATNIAADVPTTIWADSVRWRQITLNIVSNACKFTKKGSVTVEVDVLPMTTQTSQSEESDLLPMAPGQYKEERGPPHVMRFQVRDTGIGISQEELPLLFQAFSQAKPSVTREYGGTGIGLSICKTLIDNLKGTISVESKQGEGSTFVFTLPFQWGSTEREVDPSVIEDAVPHNVKRNEVNADAILSQLARLKGLRILFVDDSKVHLKLARARLGRAGAIVTLAENGQELLDEVLPLDIKNNVKQQKFDVILTDISMPVMNGDEATKILRSAGFDGVIIGVTAHAMDEQQKTFLDSGFDVVLSKPYRFDNLAGVIIEALQKNTEAIGSEVFENPGNENDAHSETEVCDDEDDGDEKDDDDGDNNVGDVDNDD